MFCLASSSEISKMATAYFYVLPNFVQCVLFYTSVFLMIIDGFVSLVYLQVFYESWAALISRILVLWAVACRFGGE